MYAKKIDTGLSPLTEEFDSSKGTLSSLSVNDQSCVKATAHIIVDILTQLYKCNSQTRLFYFANGSDHMFITLRSIENGDKSSNYLKNNERIRGFTNDVLKHRGEHAEIYQARQNEEQTIPHIAFKISDMLPVLMKISLDKNADQNIINNIDNMMSVCTRKENAHLPRYNH